MDRNKPNSFDALRIAGALIVFHSHLVGMATGREPRLQVPSISWGGMGVILFFTVSGYLVAGSLIRNPGTGSYLASRALRIYPGLVAAQVLTILGCAFVTDLAPSEYFLSDRTLAFLLTNLTSLAQARELALPGVMLDARWKFTNGSIWTIAYEIACYVALLAVFKLAPRRALAPLCVLICVICCGAMLYANPLSGIDRFTRLDIPFAAQFALSFFLGAGIAFGRPGPTDPRTIALMALGTALLWGTPIFQCLAIAWAGIFFVEVGKSPALSWYPTRKLGDLSYGVYLYSYPVSNLAVTRLQEHLPIKVIEMMALLVVVSLSVISWRLFEAPFIALKHSIRSRPGRTHATVGSDGDRKGQGRCESPAPIV